MNSLPSFRVSRRIPEQGIDFICKMYDFLQIDVQVLESI